MANLRVAQHVNAPPEVVFAAATDWDHWAESIRGIARIEKLTPGPFGVGARFRETRVMFGREATEEMEVSSFDPPHQFTLRTLACGAEMVAEHRFVPDIAGTMVEVTVSMRPRSFLARMAAPLAALMAGPLKKCLAADLSDLKAAAEGQAPVDWRADPAAARRGYETTGA